MTALTDLTWAEVETATGTTGAISIVGTAPNAKVVIDVSLLTGTAIGDLSSGGVVDFLLKLREACAAAQITANANQNVGERLATFPALVYGNLASDGTVQVQGSIVGKMTVSPQTLHLIGVNN